MIAVLVAVGDPPAAGRVKDPPEKLLADLCDGPLTGQDVSGAQVDHIRPLRLQLVPAANLDDRADLQPVGRAASSHEHLKADAAGRL